MARDALEVPDVGDRGGELNVTHAVAAHPRLGDFDATTFADNTPVTHPLVFAAVAFPVLGGAKNALAKQAIHFGLEGAVVDRLRLGYFTDNLAVRQGALTPSGNSLG